MRLDEADVRALKEIVYGDVKGPAFYKDTFGMGYCAQRAAAILRRHGTTVDQNRDTGIVAFDGPAPQWCPVCKTYHLEVGEKTDAGKLMRQCPLLSVDDPRNVFANYP